MKTEQMMKFVGAAACLCLAFGLPARAEESSSTNAPSKPHGGPGLHRGPGAGGEAGGAVGAVSREEMQKFRESLKDMTPEQRQEAMQKFRQKMGAKAGGGELGGADREEMQKFRESLKDMTPEQRQEAMQKFRQKMAAKMKERIEQNDKLTAEQKKEILGAMDKLKAEREKIMSDSSLNEQQKREALKKLAEQARELFQKHREALEGQRQPKAGDKPQLEQKKAVEAKPSV